MLQTTEVGRYREITDTEIKNCTGTLIMHDTSRLAYAKEIPSLHVQKSGIQKIQSRRGSFLNKKILE